MPNMPLPHAAHVFQKMAFHPIPTRPEDKALALKPGQRKLYERRRPTEQEVRAWWTREPRYNVALLLGPACRLLIVNINQKHGHDGLGTLKRKGLAIADDLTPTILTPPNGFALCFKPPDREQLPFPFKTHVVVPDYPGIELRGTGGYQLVPPSTVKATTRDPAGDYRFAMPWTISDLFTECPELPDWLLTLWMALDRQTTAPHTTPTHPTPRITRTRQKSFSSRTSRSQDARRGSTPTPQGPTGAAARHTPSPRGAPKKQKLLLTGARAYYCANP